VTLGFAGSARLPFGLAVLLTVTAGHARLVARQTERAAQISTLSIVVIEGEDAVNIVQQKTAVAPVVEVRDRNDQPVSGAVVTFAIRRGRASFSGARTLTVTTNAAGRAVAGGLTPTGSGAVQIMASASFQGQTAVATIVQTNVMTTAGAAAGGAGAGGGSTAGGAGGGAGGGLSTTTLAIVGGSVAGGVVAAKGIAGESAVTPFSGTFSGPVVTTSAACTFSVAHMGTVRVEIETASDGTVTGTGGVSQTRTVTGAQGNCGTGVQRQVGYSESDGCCSPQPQVRGTTANLTFSGSHPGGGGSTWTYAFAGALDGNTRAITGTFTLTVTSPGLPTINPSFPVTLR
jgi:hypothetical protein